MYGVQELLNFRILNAHNGDFYFGRWLSKCQIFPPPKLLAKQYHLSYYEIL